jgi:broad specificity phosphatase PhoE
MEIVLVRHGQTEWSRSGQHTSRTDLPLLPAGRHDAQALREPLARRRFALVLCSPLRRARETCELAGLGERMELCEDLREWDYGEYEGLTTKQIHERRPDWELWRDGCPGGESPQDIAARVERAIARLRQAGADAAVFAHGHVLRVLAARWLEQEVRFGARLVLGAGALCVLGFEHEREAILEWNRTEQNTKRSG